MYESVRNADNRLGISSEEQYSTLLIDLGRSKRKRGGRAEQGAVLRDEAAVEVVAQLVAPLLQRCAHWRGHVDPAPVVPGARLVLDQASAALSADLDPPVTNLHERYAGNEHPGATLSTIDNVKTLLCRNRERTTGRKLVT